MLRRNGAHGRHWCFCGSWIAWWYRKIIMQQHSVLCLITRDNNVLLGLRKNDPRKGTWSGYGGKVEQGESPLEAAHREVFEEADIFDLKISSAGIITFSSPKDKEDHVMHLFFVNDFSGQPKETKEMTPRWFSIDQIPYDQMSVTDRHWMPPLLEGQQVNGHFQMDEHYNILEFKIFPT